MPQMERNLLGNSKLNQSSLAYPGMLSGLIKAKRSARKQESACEDTVFSLGWSDRVREIQSVREIQTYLPASAIFFLSSTSEKEDERDP